MIRGKAGSRHTLRALARANAGDSCVWAATGILGGLFPTPLCHLGRWFQMRLYRLRPVGVPSRRIQDILFINEDQRLHGGRRQSRVGNEDRDKSRLALFRAALSLHQTATYYKPAPAGQETAPAPDYNRYGRALCPKVPPAGNSGADCRRVKPGRVRRAGRCTGFVNEQNPCNINPALAA